MPSDLANAPAKVAELMAGKDLRGEGAAPTKKMNFNDLVDLTDKPDTGN
jgi:hypothetical protein